MGRWAWSSGGFDWDLDGVPEILIAAGMVTNPSPNDLNSFFWRQVVAKTPAEAARCRRLRERMERPESIHP